MAIYTNNTTPYRDQPFDLLQQLELASEFETDLQYTVNWSRKFYFNAEKAEIVLFYQSNYTAAIDVKMDGSVLEEKSSFNMLGFTFSSKLEWGSYVISVVKTVFKKIGPLTCFMKFLLPEVAPYCYKSTIRSCTEY